MRMEVHNFDTTTYVHMYSCCVLCTRVSPFTIYRMCASFSNEDILECGYVMQFQLLVIRATEKKINIICLCSFELRKTAKAKIDQILSYPTSFDTFAASFRV